MKKNNIALGAVYIVLGMLSLYFAVTYVEDEMSGLFYGFAGALGGNGIFMIFQIVVGIIVFNHLLKKYH
ncbi:MAG: hypothetical protein Q4A78_11670 [Peptostreptococcaceae bacterium]|nr:hypothetical protein [Peptostreptococcaceae bacterium]